MEKAAAKKSREKIDWEAIERKYSAGVESMRSIACEFGVDEGTIRYRAKKGKWDRDLSLKVKSRTESLLRSAEFRTETQNQNAEKEASHKEEVEVSAAARVQVILSHRKDIAALREKASVMAEELDACAEDLSKRASILKTLADTQKNLIAAEREAFGLNDQHQDKTDSSANAPSNYTDAERAVKLMFLLSKAKNAHDVG